MLFARMHYVPEVKEVQQVLGQEEEVALDEFAKLEVRLEFTLMIALSMQKLTGMEQNRLRSEGKSVEI